RRGAGERRGIGDRGRGGGRGPRRAVAAASATRVKCAPKETPKQRGARSAIIWWPETRRASTPAGGRHHDSPSAYRGRDGFPRANARRPDPWPLGAGESDDAPPRAQGHRPHVEVVTARRDDPSIGRGRSGRRGAAGAPARPSAG